MDKPLYTKQPCGNCRFLGTCKQVDVYRCEEVYIAVWKDWNGQNNERVFRPDYSFSPRERTPEDQWVFDSVQTVVRLQVRR